MKNIIFGLSWFLCLSPFLAECQHHLLCCLRLSFHSLYWWKDILHFYSCVMISIISFCFFFFEFPSPCLHVPSFLVWNEVKVAQSCPTLCDPMDYTVCGILQARILEWVAFPFSRGSSQPRDYTQVFRIEGGSFTSWATKFFISALYILCTQLLSCVWLFATPWTVAHQAPLFMGFSRQEYWSGLLCPPPGDLPNPGIESRSPPLHTDPLSSEPLEKLKNTVWVAFQLKYELEFVYDFDDFFFCTDYFFWSFVTPSNFCWKPGMLFWKL